jgi:proteasome lid subunit RPN8/RPN11
MSEDVTIKQPKREEPDSSVLAATHRRDIEIHTGALRAMSEHIRGDTAVERGGVMIGDLDELTGALVITDAVEGRGAISQVASLTFTHETWAHVNEVLERDHPGKRMLGWYHSHPGFSAFLSEYDTFIQQNFFSQPWQVAYVLDPLLEDEAFFGWEDGRIVRYDAWTVRASGAAAGRDATAASKPSVPVRLDGATTSQRAVPFAIGAGILGAIVGLLFGMRLADDAAALRRLESAGDEQERRLQEALVAVEPRYRDPLQLAVGDRIPLAPLQFTDGRMTQPTCETLDPAVLACPAEVEGGDLERYVEATRPGATTMTLKYEVAEGGVQWRVDVPVTVAEPAADANDAEPQPGANGETGGPSSARSSSPSASEGEGATTSTTAPQPDPA